MNPVSVFPGRLAIQQRVLPAYRAPFFNLLAEACQGGLSVFAGSALPEEAIAHSGELDRARFYPARNLNLFPIRSPFYQCWQVGWRRWLEAWQPDVLIVEANPRYPTTRMAVRWMHARRKPVLGWGLGVPSLAAGSFGQSWLEAWRQRQRVPFLRSLDGMIAYSRRGAEEYRRLGFPPGRVFVAPNAVTPRPTHPPPSRPEEVGHPPVVLFVGRMQARKRLDLLFQACAALPSGSQPDVWIVGDGPDRSDFERQAQQLYSKARFFGERRGEELEPLFAGADLFVLPGTGGLAIQQAMAHGLPVVVAQGDGTQEDLVCPSNGWLVPPGDLSSLIQTLKSALGDRRRLREMGAESYRIVSEEVNLEKMANVFVQAACQVMQLEKTVS